MAQSVLIDDMDPDGWDEERAALKGNVLQKPATDGGWAHSLS